jgi:hypothetical protein
VADREAQVVEPVEHAGEWGSGVLVDDELTGVDAVVEPQCVTVSTRRSVSDTGQRCCQTVFRGRTRRVTNDDDGAARVASFGSTTEWAHPGSNQLGNYDSAEPCRT